MKAPGSIYGKSITYSNLHGTGVFNRFNTGKDIIMRFHQDNTYSFKQSGDKRTGASASYVYKKTDDHLGHIVNIIDSNKPGLKGCLMRIHLNFKTGKGFTKVLMHTSRESVKQDRLTFNFHLH